MDPETRHITQLPPASADDAFARILAGMRAEQAALRAEISGQRRDACVAFAGEIERRVAHVDFFVAAFRESGRAIDPDAERCIEIFLAARDAYAALRRGLIGWGCVVHSAGGNA